VKYSLELKKTLKRDTKSRELPIKGIAKSYDIVHIIVSALKMQTPYCHRLRDSPNLLYKP